MLSEEKAEIEEEVARLQSELENSANKSTAGGVDEAVVHQYISLVEHAKKKVLHFRKSVKEKGKMRLYRE